MSERSPNTNSVGFSVLKWMPSAVEGRSINTASTSVTVDRDVFALNIVIEIADGHRVTDKQQSIFWNRRDALLQGGYLHSKFRLLDGSTNVMIVFGDPRHQSD